MLPRNFLILRAFLTILWKYQEARNGPARVRDEPLDPQERLEGPGAPAAPLIIRQSVSVCFSPTATLPQNFLKVFLLKIVCRFQNTRILEIVSRFHMKGGANASARGACASDPPPKRNCSPFSLSISLSTFVSLSIPTTLHRKEKKGKLEGPGAPAAPLIPSSFTERVHRGSGGNHYCP
jgi:hypothetical protein